MNSTVVVRANAQAEPSLIVFGRDDAGKPRASWFDVGSAGLAAKAADLMKMRVLRVETEEQKAVARQLAPGRVFASGRAFTPFARASGVQPARRARWRQQRPFHEGKHQRQTRCGREQRIGGLG